ncbi:hypothetical protein [Caldanaerobacter subterraneus]|uniref:Uncharacterized protein n=1 Tax=Caldanaerobacter subterraneus TaxID=911092 RepID=A0A7Y2L764_9THEO|nr:hypothetical protein [Caldanaerobacter subterraneus]NNG67047.1 hypothetical protein [Caldanaerobacter subterraneus]
MKKITIISLILFSILLSSCYVKTSELASNSLDIKKAVSLPQNTVPVGFDKYEKRVLLMIEDKNQKIELGFYDLKNGKIEALVKPVDSNKNIHNAVTDGKYVAWVEASDNLIRNDWSIYVKDLASRSVTKIDYGKLDNEISSKIPFSQEPKLSLNESKLVWSTYELENDKILCSLILYDLKKNKKDTIRSIDGLGKSYIGHPKVFGDFIVWHEGKIEGQSEVGEVYLYNIANGQIVKISDNGVTPNIYGENIVWVSDKSRIMLYNIKKKNIVEITRGGGIEERWLPSLNDEYVTWYDSMGKVELYNIKLAKIQILPVKTNNASRIFDNILTWIKWENDKTTPQFLVLPT